MRENYLSDIQLLFFMFKFLVGLVLFSSLFFFGCLDDSASRQHYIAQNATSLIKEQSPPTPFVTNYPANNISEEDSDFLNPPALPVIK